MSKHPVSPCNACPFHRGITPGALGGSQPQTYIGQAHGPFFLPCHKHSDFADPNWKRDHTTPQCAGAAIFRANIGVANRMPAFIHKLAANTRLVFASTAEFLAHHARISLLAAKAYLRVTTPEEMLEVELNRATFKVMVSRQPEAGESPDAGA